MPKVKANVDDNFKLLGMIKKTEEIYAISDATLNCSSFEGLALTSYESLSMGVPVISTDAGGQAELINKEVGGLVHFNENPTPEIYEREIEEYVDETIRVMNNLDEIKKNCRKRIIEGFTLDLMAKKFDRIFQELLKEDNTNEPKLNRTTYELALEAFNDLYFKYTNDYYERNLGVWPTAKKVRFPKFYRHATNFLYRIGAYKEGKNFIEFSRGFKRMFQEFIFTMKYFLRCIPSFFTFIFKCIARIITKPFRK